MRKKVFIIGLDCATPQLVFEQYVHSLPNIKRLMEKGAWGRLKSTIPPITVPAWMSMVTSKDPGQLGCYGFRNRPDYSYDGFDIADSSWIEEPAIWDILSEKKKDSVVVGVPQTYPPRPLRGCLVSGFLAPGTDSDYTYPKALKEEIRKNIGEYIIDIKEFRTDDKIYLLKQIYDMTQARFKLAEYLAKKKRWDFFMFVEMGPDRMHHAFWRFIDPTHNKYEKGNKYENALLDYYKFLDERIGRLLGILDRGTTVFVVSDHGAKKVEGGLCINEWLIKEGLLALKEYPKKLARFSMDLVDWLKTKAWGEGGYYSRVFLNVKGRQPQGIVEKSEFEALRSELAKRFAAIKDEKGNNIDTKAFKPEEVYRSVRRIAPDLIVYPGNLNWRAIGSVGYNSIFTYENDTGPDDSNHDEHGIFIMYDPAVKAAGRKEGLDILDVAPTVLDKMGIDVPGDMLGKVIG